MENHDEEYEYFISQYNRKEFDKCAFPVRVALFLYEQEYKQTKEEIETQISLLLNELCNLGMTFSTPSHMYNMVLIIRDILEEGHPLVANKFPLNRMN